MWVKSIEDARIIVMLFALCPFTYETQIYIKKHL